MIVFELLELNEAVCVCGLGIKGGLYVTLCILSRIELIVSLVKLELKALVFVFNYISTRISKLLLCL